MGYAPQSALLIGNMESSSPLRVWLSTFSCRPCLSPVCRLLYRPLRSWTSFGHTLETIRYIVRAIEVGLVTAYPSKPSPVQDGSQKNVWGSGGYQKCKQEQSLSQKLSSPPPRPVQPGVIGSRASLQVSEYKCGPCSFCTSCPNTHHIHLMSDGLFNTSGTRGRVLYCTICKHFAVQTKKLKRWLCSKRHAHAGLDRIGLQLVPW